MASPTLRVQLLEEVVENLPENANKETLGQIVDKLIHQHLDWYDESVLEKLPFEKRGKMEAFVRNDLRAFLYWMLDPNGTLSP